VERTIDDYIRKHEEFIYIKSLCKNNNISYMFLASSDDYSKLIDSTTYDVVDGSFSSVGKLSVAEANGFLLDGINFRTSATTMIIKSKYPSNSKDTTDLFKITSKIKFRNINQL